jgi:hypothetical protein
VGRLDGSCHPLPQIHVNDYHYLPALLTIVADTDSSFQLLVAAQSRCGSRSSSPRPVDGALSTRSKHSLPSSLDAPCTGYVGMSAGGTTGIASTRPRLGRRRGEGHGVPAGKEVLHPLRHGDAPGSCGRLSELAVYGGL